MTDYLWVAAGGAVGAAARHAMTVAVGARQFPWGTFTVNVCGAFLIGVIVFAWERYGGTHESDLLLRVGVCGGFTTFSSFSLDTWRLLEQGNAAAAVVYVLASVLICLGALRFARMIFAG